MQGSQPLQGRQTYVLSTIGELKQLPQVLVLALHQRQRVAKIRAIVLLVATAHP